MPAHVHVHVYVTRGRARRRSGGGVARPHGAVRQRPARAPVGGNGRARRSNDPTMPYPGYASLRAVAAALVACSALAAPARADNLVYGELLGKGGPWGLGFEHAIAPRMGIGAVGSVAVLES